MAADCARGVSFPPMPHGLVRRGRRRRAGVVRARAPRLHRQRDRTEVAMRGSVLQTWNPAWVLLPAALVVGTASTSRHGGIAAELREPSETAAACEAPSSPPWSRFEIARRVAPRQAAALAMVL